MCIRLTRVNITKRHLVFMTNSNKTISSSATMCKLDTGGYASILFRILINRASLLYSLQEKSGSISYLAICVWLCRSGMADYYSPKMEELTRINDEQREHIQDLKRQLDEEKNKLKHVQEEKVTRIPCTLKLIVI